MQKKPSHPVHPLYIATGTISGGGTAGTVPRFADDTTLEDGIISDTGSGLVINPGLVQLAACNDADEGAQIDFLGGGNGGSPFDTWSLDSFQGRMRFFTNGVSYFDLAPTRLVLSSGCDLVITAGDTTSVRLFRAAANNFQIRTNDDGSDNQEDATKPSWAMALGEGAADNWIVYRRSAGGAFVALWAMNNSGHFIPMADDSWDIGTAAKKVRTVITTSVDAGTNLEMIKNSGGGIMAIGGGSSFVQLNFYTGNTPRWHVTSGGHWYPVADNTYDIGSVALSVRDLYLQGETVGENGNNGNTADQTAFANALTDITGTSWAVGANEQWEFEIHVPFLRNASAGTVGFTINGPAGSTCAYSVFGSNTTTTFSEAYSTSLNTSTGTLGTSTSTTHIAIIRGRISTGANAGTAVGRGVTTAAGATCAPRNGTWVRARRVS